MKKRLTMIAVSLFLLMGTALAQTKITGTVISGDDGEPIIGASVVVQGATGAGAITDTDRYAESWHGGHVDFGCPTR